MPHMFDELPIDPAWTRCTLLMVQDYPTPQVSVDVSFFIGEERQEFLHGDYTRDELNLLQARLETLGFERSKSMGGQEIGIIEYSRPRPE